MATSLGRGTLYFMAVQIVFMASGYAIHAGLGRLLGPAGYGIFGVVIYLITLITMLLNSGVPQATSRYIAVDNSKAVAIKGKSVRIQFLSSLAVFLIYFSLAGVIANMLGDTGLTKYIRISAFMIPAYAFYNLYASFLNGLRNYSGQALCQLVYSVAKVIGVFALVFFGFDVYGAIFGYMLGPLAGFILAWHYFKPEESGDDFETRKLIDFALPIIVFSTTFTFLMSVDLFLVKRILAENVQAGFYTAASTLAKIPFFVLSGLTLAIFPAISKSTFARDEELTKNYINNSLRYLFMLLVPTVLLFSATSSSLVDFFYSSKYLSSAPPLAMLVFGAGAYTVLQILATIIIASGRPTLSMIIVLILVPIALAANTILIPIYGLVGAAIATTITSFIGLLIASGFVAKIFKTLVGLKSLTKICIASLTVYAILLQISFPTIALPFVYLLMFGLYFAILILIKEVDRKDYETFKKIVPLR